jgi:energy-converting hydrogenase Eha subunit E
MAPDQLASSSEGVLGRSVHDSSLDPGRQDPIQRLLTTQLSQAPVAFVSLAYAAGFIIMTNLLARWRLPAFDLLRVRYLTAGLYYLVMTAAFILVFFLFVGCVTAGRTLLQSHAAKRKALADFESGGDEATLRKELAIHHERVKPFFRQAYILSTVTALVLFPICILFFTPTARSRYVLLFFLGTYGWRPLPDYHPSNRSAEHSPGA